ncbi:MAG: TIGR04219 family outer membrane beta-barrel protein [Cellvibrionales bacterium]|nr:TIGR04219 family outer membrane beta-barrel protein [Cellvibrionales bacterium]
MFKKLLLGAALSSAVMSAQSDNIGFEVGAELWRTTMTGYLDVEITNVGQKPYTLNIDLEDNLSMEKNTSGRFYFDLYHPLPYLPNISASVNRVEHSGNGNPPVQDIISGANIKGLTLDINGTINLNHFDITGFWSPIDNSLIGIDVGITLRQFDGKIDFIGQNDYVRIPVTGKIDNLYALAYGKLTAHLPLTGLSAHLAMDAGYNFDSKNSEQAFDLDLGLTYRTVLGLGVGIGYRYFDADLEAEAEAVDQRYDAKYKLTTQGPYLSLSYRL